MRNGTQNALAGAGMANAWWSPTRPEATSVDSVEPLQGDGDSQLPFRGLMVFTFILLLAPQFIFPFLQPFRIAMLSVLVTVTALVYTRFIRGVPIISLARGGIYPFLIALWAIVTAPLSYWPGGSISFLTGPFFKPLVLFVLLANIVNTREKLIRIVTLLVLIAIPLSFTGVKNFLGGQFNNGERVMGYQAALTGNPNDLALMLNLLLPFCIALFFIHQRGIVRLLLAAIIALVVAAVIVTFSRAGFLALASMFLIYVWRLRGRPERRFIPLILMLAVMALPLIPSSYYERLGTITNINADDTGSAQIRLRDSLAATEFVFSNPLVGAGLGMNTLALNEVRGETWTQIHNVYLQYAVELGIPGLLIFLMFYRRCFGNTREVLKAGAQHGRDDMYYITEAVRIGLMVFAIEAFFHPSAYQFYFYYIAGLAVAVKAIFDAEHKEQVTGSELSKRSLHKSGTGSLTQ